jgi:hypothetical protein
MRLMVPSVAKYAPWISCPLIFGGKKLEQFNVPDVVRGGGMVVSRGLGR